MAPPEPSIEFRPERPAPVRELPLWAVLFVSGLVLVIGLGDGRGGSSPTSEAGDPLANPGDVVVAVAAHGSQGGSPQLVDVSGLDRSSGRDGRYAALDGDANIGDLSEVAGEGQRDLGLPMEFDAGGEARRRMSGSGGASPSEEGTFARGIRNGEWLVRWPNGEIQSRGAYENGLRDGLWQSFSVTGLLIEDAHYEGGVLEGDWRAYSLDGVLIGEGQHDGNHRSGTWTLWYSDGSIKESGTYIDGLREGEWEFYDDLGLPTTRSGHYRAGVKID